MPTRLRRFHRRESNASGPRATYGSIDPAWRSCDVHYIEIAAPPNRGADVDRRVSARRPRADRATRSGAGIGRRLPIRLLLLGRRLLAVQLVRLGLRVP